VTSLCSGLNTITYQTDFGEMYALVIPDQSNLTDSITMTSFCKYDSCTVNEYLNNLGVCQACPEGSIAPAGSTSISSCVACASEGYVLENSKSRRCNFDKYKQNPTLSSSTHWRLMAHRNQMHPLHYWWLVDKIRLYSSVSCDPQTEVNWRNGTFFDTGNPGSPWVASAAFNTSEPNSWYGTDGGRSVFWIGVGFSTPVTVKCINFYQGGNDIAREINIQAKNGAGNWETSWIAKNLGSGTITTFNYLYTFAPTSAPMTPTVTTTVTPTQVPVPIPFPVTSAPISPTVTPTRVPVPIQFPVTSAPISPTVTPTRVPVPIQFPVTSAPIAPTVTTTVTPTRVPVPIQFPLPSAPIAPTVTTTATPTLVPVPIQFPLRSAPIAPTVTTTATPTLVPVPIQSRVPVKSPVQAPVRARCTSRCGYFFSRGYHMYQFSNGSCKKRCFRTITAGLKNKFTCKRC
jgi:hypothetical protein